jgi:hypothetical protein
MKKHEVTKWLIVMKASLNSFPEVSKAKKIEALREAIRLLENEESESPIKYDDMVNCVNNMPPATPIRPKGHWIVTAEEYYKAINEKGGGVNENTDYFVDDIACSECLAKFCILENEVERFDFCPNCGADMRGEE